MRQLSRAVAQFAALAAIALGSSQLARAQQTAGGEQFVVTSGHPDATAAGMAVLRGGGNVVDAAVATSLCLGVAEPYGSGIGGKGMLLYRDGKTGRVYSIEAMGAAPQSLNADEFADRPSRERYVGYTAVAIPGLVAALNAAHENWGSQPWSDVVTPAAELAERGVTVSAKMYQIMRPKRNLLRRDDEAARMFLADGETPEVGAVMKYPQLADTLRHIAEEGAAALYDGPIADTIVEASREGGSSLTAEDFRHYEPRWGEPLAVEYDSYRVYSCPPPLTGGVTVLATLRAIDGVAGLETTDGRDPKYIDLVGRVLLSVYPRVSRTIADVPTARDDAQELFADKSVGDIRAEAEEAKPVEPDKATAEAVSATFSVRHHVGEASTTHLIVADREGNIVCLTQSLSYHFGACVVAPGTGVLLNNSMSNFATGNPEGCNYVAPGKRERSTIAPIIATKNEKPVLALGIPGGQRIPTTTLQLLSDILHFEKTLAEAFDRPRFHVRRPRGADEAANIVDLENDAPAVFDEKLIAMGWQPERHERNGAYFGGGSAVKYLEDGTLQGVSDQRRTNAADGD